ncbi:Non-ribosomal peptide synthetase nps2 [Madurella fahalii]|uniref:Non-ribosomal peptide synthetase nps2 n=1 Tax=Madurella fahalii TaxID=1157608 RepID=A0ABQ0GC60_9PEZI
MNTMNTTKQKVNDTLSIANHPATRLPGPSLLHLLVQKNSQHGEPAIHFLTQDDSRVSLSYTDFHHASETLARRISALTGSRVDSKPFIVPVLVPQSPELYIALLAILKAGGAFCPMNLDAPVERTKFILDDVSAAIVITTSGLASKLPRGEHVVLMVDDEASHGATVFVKHRKPQARDLAYVMYTSGSTGSPKGVGVSHESATQSLLAHDRHIPQFSRFLQFAAPTFDVSVFEIFFSFFRGKTLVSCTRPAMLNDLPAVIRNLEVDACELTPTVAGSLLRRRENTPGLRLLLTIGEMLTEPVVEEFGGSEERPSMLWGMYGPTEAAIHCTLQPAFARGSAVRNIGMPLDTVSAFILEVREDDDANLELQVLPHGQVGELALGGYQLAEGYLNRPQQTSSAFVETRYGRLYRTGDKAVMTPDGTLECFGRIADGQVKLRGQRIELGEIEHAALKTQGCHGAVAAVTDSMLVLFCAVDKRSGMISAIGESCRKWLPGFMLPSDIVVVEGFPRLVSGKVNRKQLVEDYKESLQLEMSPGVQYRDGLEKQLCDLVSETLRVKVQPDQELFRAGLDSLSAIKLASVLGKAGFNIGAVDVLEARTISAMGSRLRADEDISPRAPHITAESRDRNLAGIAVSHPVLSSHTERIEAIVPCTPLQTSMLAETMADSRAYCNWVELRFWGSPSAGSIRYWFMQLAEKNEILRTGFIHHEGRFLQTIFKELSESNISMPDRLVRDFTLREHKEFLFPFRIQISPPTERNDTVVVMQLHHAVYDGWSLDLLLSDLARLTRGEQPDPRPQFREFSSYHQSESFRESCDAAREFWAANLQGFQPPPFPILHQNATSSIQVLSSSLSLDVKPLDLKTALQRIDCGPQTVFQAAVAWLWSSMVGSEDVVVGSVTSGRTLPIPRIEDIVGPCIAAVPLRIGFSQVRTIRDLLISIHVGNRAALRHSVLPLSELKRAIGVRPGQTVYDVLFIYQESLQGRQITDAFKETAHQDYLETKLLIEVEPRLNDFICRFTWHSDAIPRTQIEILKKSLQALVSHIIANLDSEASSLRKSQPPHLLSVYNPNPSPCSGVPDLAYAVERVAAEHPGKDAICFADHISDGIIKTTTISFAELNSEANKIAWRIRERGLNAGGSVAIIMEKSILLYVGILAILKAGCAYLPLLPSTPAARIETILQQAGVNLCLLDTDTHTLVTGLPCDFVDLRSFDIRSAPTRNVERTPDPNRLAYIIYTSGSTGTPKGVCLTQLNITSNLDALSQIYPVRENSRLLQSCSQAFDVSVFEIFFAWTRAICLCAGTNDTLFEDLERAIRKLKVTHLSMTPTVASLVDPEKVPLVEFLVTAGEAMTEAVARKWGEKLYQGYGPSETTNICSVKKMGPNDTIQHLGWSFKNTSTFVLARDGMEPVPLGGLGELCFGGDQIAQGYLNMPDLTAAKFVNHPAYGRLYKSGDLGRMHQDGSIFIVGRVDDQIKVRGQRVELHEITEAVKRSTDAADCITLFLRGGYEGSRDQIVSYWVPSRSEAIQFRVLDINDGLKTEIQSMYCALSAQLPTYMVPSAIVPISTLPTTASGKLDKARLKQAFNSLQRHYLACVGYGAEFVADDGEWSSIELQVAEAVTEALHAGRSDIQRWTPLTTLGLDSISAIQVSGRLYAQFGTRLPISLILQNPSVARLARVLPTVIAASTARETDLLPKQLVDKVVERLDGRRFDKILPCTPLQEAMLATSAGEGRYLNRMLFKVNADLARLKNAWNAICARHGILRTCFVSTVDAHRPILQVVLAQWQPPWHHFDACRSTVDDCISQHARAVPDPLDTMEPAVSFASIGQGDRVYLSLICHHALYDGVAIERLLYEVEQLFGGSSLLPTPEYERFLRESLALPASTDKFWMEHLADYQPKMVTQLKPGDLEMRPQASARELDIPLSQIKTRVRELGVSLLAMVQSAWAIALGCVFRTSDICFGNVMNGRSLLMDDIDKLVAPCFNTIPVRVDISDSERNVDLMKAFQRINAELIQYQFTPLRRIQSLLSQHATRRIFDTLLLLQQPRRPLDQSLWALERDEGEMDVPLICEVTPVTSTDRLTIELHAAESQQLSPEAVELVFDLFCYAIRDCIQFPASNSSLNGIPQRLMERVSRFSLRPPEPAIVPRLSDSPTEEWTTTEVSIRAVLAALSPSDTDRIQRHTTIYQLGLDSITAVQIASMLRERGYQILASDVIENPTCESLAQYIQTRVPDTEAKPTFDIAGFRSIVRPQIVAQGIALDRVETILPCTPLQSAMMAQFIKSGGVNYFNHIVFQLQEGVNPTQMIEAWRVVSTTHPILRTGIIPVEHNECDFAMIEYRMADTARVELVGSLDPGLWRLEASRAAVEEPWERLWKVAVVKAKEGFCMHLAIHHVLYDAQSLQLILEDLAKALASGQVSASSCNEDVVLDILRHVSAETERSERFWKQQGTSIVINGFPVMTPLRVASREILTEASTSSVSLTALEAAAAKSGHTLQVILQAAWTRVLSAYLGETSVVFGVVLSGRNTDATRNAVFPCITTLPVISSNINSNLSLLTEMLQYNSELYKQQHQPLTRIQQWLGCPNSRLFDTLLVYQKLGIELLESRPWRIVHEEANIDYSVSIEVEPKACNRLDYRITFFSDVLPKEQARMLLRQLDEAVRHLALEPEGQESDLSMSYPDLFSILPPETHEIPTTVKFLHQFVELQAASTPDAAALHFVAGFDNEAPVGRIWSYKQLDTNGNRVAQMLLPHVKSGDIVAVYFDKCPEAYFAILGVLKAGCAFVALDPGAPRPRNEFIISDSGASVLLTPRQGKDFLELSVTVPVLSIDEGSMAAAPPDTPTLRRELQTSDVCYCLYTSGTTGTPKGCEITHDNAVQCMLAFQHIFKGHWQEDSKWLQFASLHFDVSVLEQYWSWSVGITLVAAPRDLILDDLATTIRRLGITHIDLTPSLARLLHPDDVPSLCRGVFITGGESLKQEILDVWGSKGVIYNFYGPTEATIGVTVYPRVPTAGRASNIGRQFINVGSYVLKPETEQPVIRGGVGELCVSGRLVGKGYLKRDELTAQRFPTLQRSGDRIYRTGDLVRVLHDGCFDFLGRADDQVKLRGQRLEVGEINHAIRKGVEIVTDVATLVVRNETHQKDFLVSFIVADDQVGRREGASCLKAIESKEASALCRRARDACRSKLPSYMVPTYVLQLPFIPLSANNKAEIKELRKFFSSLSQDKLVAFSSADKEPRALDPREVKVAKVLATVRSVDTSSLLPESSIFELGIDSISVLRFCRALKNEGFTHATPSLILQHPLISDLASALEMPKNSSNLDLAAAARQLVQACVHKHRPHVCKELGITPDQIEYIAPCSPLQQGMISRSVTDNAYYNTFQYILAPKVSTSFLRDAYQRAVDALPILRTKFVGTVDGFVQVALKKCSLSSCWREMQLCGTSVEDAVSMTRESWISRNHGCLAQPLEAVLVNGGDSGHRLLLLHIFHGLYDANSLALVLDRVAGEYLALTGDHTVELTSMPSFLDALCYGPLQDFSSSKPFWVEHLDGATVTPVFDPPRDAVALTVQRRLSIRRLEALRVSLGVTHQALVQSAWVSVLARHLIVDPVIGIIVSGRVSELDGAERVVGPLFNTLPFRARTSAQGETSGRTWLSLIRQCHDFNTEVLAFQHTPLRDIQKWCSGGNPLFNTLFSFQRNEATAAEKQGLWKAAPSESNIDYPLALEANLDNDGCLTLLIVAQGDSNDSGNLVAMMDELEASFDAMLQNPRDAVLHGEPQSADKVGGGGALRERLPSVEPTGPTFTWTREALLIRDEIAALAGAAPESVTETTPIFGLGLDSIDVIKLSARLKRHGVRIKTGELMKAQTVAASLQILEARTSDSEEASNARPRLRSEICDNLRKYAAALGGVGEGDIVLPTTPLQDSMVMEMIESNFQLYFNHDIRELAPTVDLDKLKGAWRTVIAGSPILRTRFLPIDIPFLESAYCQVIAQDPSPYITDISLNDTDELETICDTAVQLARKGAGRSHLLQLAFASVGQKRFLVLSLAHALYDGWSLALIHQDLQAAYEGRYVPRTMDDYLGRVEAILFPGHQDASSFWSGFLEGAASTIFPEEEDREDSDQEGAIHRVELVSALPADEVASFCRAHAVTLQTLGQACWAAVLASRTGSLDVTFGVVLACRDNESSEDLLFPTMNTVAVRNVLHGSVSSWVRYTQDNMTSIAPYQHFPLRKAQKLAQVSGQLFNTLFIYQRNPSSQQGWELLVKSVGGSSAVEYPVCVEMAASGAEPVWRAAIGGAYGSSEDSLGLLQALDSVLIHLVRSSDSDVLAFNGPRISICGLEPILLGVSDCGSTTAISEPSTEGSDTWSPVEERIRDVFSDVSGVPAASILKSHGIYHLGLDSINAIKAGSLLRKNGIDIGLRSMLKAGSIADMARLVRDAQALLTPDESDFSNEVSSLEEIDVSAILAAAQIDKTTVKEVLPASPMQVHMLSVWQNTNGEVFYPYFTYIVSSKVDRVTITTAWDALIEETPILRTLFVSTGARSVPILQVVLDPSAFAKSWSSPSSGTWKSDTRAAVQPYHSLHLEVHGTDQWKIRLKIHHALYDAVSLPAIMDRFAVLCTDTARETTSPVFDQRNILALQSSEANQAARREFWTGYLAEAGPTPQPFKKESQDEATPKSRTAVVKRAAVQRISDLMKLCKDNGVSLQALLFAAYAEVLALSTAGARPEGVVFGVYLANRAEISAPQSASYPFLRLVPLRVTLTHEGTLIDVATAIQQDIHAISSPVNVEVGLWEIKDWTGLTVESFVNFISAGPSHDDHEDEAVLFQQVTTPDAEFAEGHWRNAARGHGPPQELSSNPVRDAYADAFDIEVSVEGDDMTIGVFGPPALGVAGGLAIINNIAKVLERAV